MNNYTHTPVMAKEAVEYLNIKAGNKPSDQLLKPVN
jgi:16S rRNA C1402 N4-methylase RsmH